MKKLIAVLVFVASASGIVAQPVVSESKFVDVDQLKFLEQNQLVNRS